jgi:hypothetical protein
MLTVDVIDLKNQTSTLPQAADSALLAPVVASEIKQRLPHPAGSDGCLLATSYHKELARLDPAWAAVPWPTVGAFPQKVRGVDSIFRDSASHVRVIPTGETQPKLDEDLADGDACHHDFPHSVRRVFYSHTP